MDLTRHKLRNLMITSTFSQLYSRNLKIIFEQRTFQTYFKPCAMWIYHIPPPWIDPSILPLHIKFLAKWWLLFPSFNTMPFINLIIDLLFTTLTIAHNLQLSLICLATWRLHKLWLIYLWMINHAVCHVMSVICSWLAACGSNENEDPKNKDLRTIRKLRPVQKRRPIGKRRPVRKRRPGQNQRYPELF